MNRDEREDEVFAVINQLHDDAEDAERAEHLSGRRKHPRFIPMALFTGVVVECVAQGWSDGRRPFATRAIARLVAPRELTSMPLVRPL
jgi:hypothetical protein